VKSRLVDFGYWLGWNALWIMPTRWAYFLFNKAAKIVWRLEMQTNQTIELNLARVLDCESPDPRIRPLSLETMQSYMRYYCETFMLPRWTDEQLLGKVRTEGSEQVMEALKTGGVVPGAAALGKLGLGWSLGSP
jgi:phosphatidylinositol dimannoside acyltransferase